MVIPKDFTVTPTTGLHCSNVWLMWWEFSWYHLYNKSNNSRLFSNCYTSIQLAQVKPLPPENNVQVSSTCFSSFWWNSYRYSDIRCKLPLEELSLLLQPIHLLRVIHQTGFQLFRIHTIMSLSLEEVTMAIFMSHYSYDDSSIPSSKRK